MVGFGRKAVSAFGATRRFNEGGVVPGSGNSDTVPAMLTPGEVVMNKAAVQQYGTDTLLGMNAAAGGNNKPSFSGGRGGGKKIGGLPGLGGGGGGTNALTEQAKVKTFGSALGDFFSGDDGRSRRMTDLEKSQRMAGGGLVQYFNKGGEVKKEKPKFYADYIKEGAEILFMITFFLLALQFQEQFPQCQVLLQYKKA